MNCFQNVKILFQIIYWQSNYILVIALDEYLEIYQLPQNVLTERAEVLRSPKRAYEPPPIFEAIQQLMLIGKLQKLFLISSSKQRIMIIACVNFTKLYGKYRQVEI